MTAPAPFELTLAAVTVAAEKALNEGRMQIQNPKDLGMACFYLKDGFCCVIGSALPPALALEIEGTPGIDVGIYEMLEAGTFVTCDKLEKDTLVLLQKKHDALVSDSSGMTIPEKVSAMRAALAEARV